MSIQSTQLADAAQLLYDAQSRSVPISPLTQPERVLATIRAPDPSVTVLSETREPASDVRIVQRLAARSSVAPATFLDPAANPAIAIAAALEEMARTYERPHEPIPALAGHTPRECANDPTRRPDPSRRSATCSPRRLSALIWNDRPGHEAAGA